MSSYTDQRQKHITKMMREILSELPPYLFDFFRGIEHTTSMNTRLAYAYDLRLFFEYLYKEYPPCKALNSIREIPLELIEKVSPRDLEMYLEYLTYYEKEEGHEDIVSHQNGLKGKARKLSSLKSFYQYFYKQQRILTNPSALVDMPKIHEKPIVKLDVDEVARLLDTVEDGTDLTDHQKRYHAYTKKRDLALISLLLGTGIRVSECVGLNIEDIDFNYNGIRITRKGGNETIIYFGNEVERALLDYLEEREEKVCKEDDTPLFLSLQNKRMSVRSVQILVKKYSQLVTQLKTITPHKLRSTYGTTLYQETGDIYLVADVLGHKDVNTTKKHYAQMDDARRRMAAGIVKLRD
ncbi:tyrosine-type recombinase/integrase [Niameybacter massiliensis]|uniref:Tyrosine-type recombinase/integrase n=1 Tax=Holtiella tumoricola TaxID=3018743 RepID=A0AA42DM73_9FIRM|nr:tyrosine-type recombinase/integrase [Holtiella tumoricola]MDA3731707.1 tyrosine-type recombinase/integrase [Holtiella tumoricola]